MSAEVLRMDDFRRAPLTSEPLLSKQRLAEHYGVTTWTVDYWVRNGMPYVAGTRRRFRLSEVEKWHEERG